MNTTLISRIVIICFLLSSLIVIPLPKVQAAPQTYTIKIAPSFDTWIDYDTYTWHNDSTTLDFNGHCCNSGTKWKNRIAVEWNTSDIPDTAIITNASINFTCTVLDIDYNSYMYVNQISNKPTESTAISLWQDCQDGGAAQWDQGYTRRGTSTATGYYEFNTTGDGDVNLQLWSMDPCQDLQDNLTADWFAVGILGRSSFAYRIAQGHIASLESPSYEPMYLWVEYTFNGPYIDDPSPSNGASEVSLSPQTCIDLSHPSGTNMDIEWQWYNTSDSTWHTYGTNNTVTNGTYCQLFDNATLPATTYQWRVRANDSFGNWSNRSFSFTTVGCAPPTNLDCNRNDSYSINVSWTEFPDGTGTTHTLVYYRLGFSPPTYLSGTLGANTTNEYAVIEGLDNAECYSFGLYTNYEDSEGDWTLSSRNSLSPCCTSGGTYRFYIRYENTTFDDDGDGIVETTDFYNNIINLSRFNCSEHMLEVHYSNYATEYWYINESLWEAPTGMNQQYLEIETLYNPLYFVFHWNYSIYDVNNDSYNCSCNYTCSYSRTLLPISGYEDTNHTNITFYFIVDRHIYNDYYVDDPDCNKSVEYDFNNNLAHYNIWFEDRTNLFGQRLDYDSYASFFAYNATETKLIVHQQYLDSYGTVHPTLLYNKDYGVGINCSYTDNRYEHIGYFKGSTTVSPDQSDIVVVPKYVEQRTFEYFNVDFGWTGTNQLWVYFEDTQSDVTNINLTVRWTTNNTILYQHDVNSNENNFTIPGSNSETTYYINITLTHSQWGTMYIVFLTGTYIEPLTTATEINNILQNIFGQLPENLDTGERMQWYMLPVFFIGLIPLSLFGAKAPAIAALGVGFWMALFGVAVSGIPIQLVGMGAFLVLMGILMIIAKVGIGGR